MNEKQTAQQLFDEKLISSESLQNVNAYFDRKVFSVRNYLFTFLYIGVLLLASGLGILIYKNIDTIGHLAIVILVGLLSAGCFAFCFFNKKPFSPQQTKVENVWFDYILLLGALLLVTFIGYLQFEFKLFGERWGLATFIPCVILFFSAYYFDHIGILSMAIVLLGSWLGIAVAPVDLFKQNDFGSSRFIYTALALGIALAFASYYSHKFDFKKHFYFTYLNFALHMCFVAALCGLFSLHLDMLWYLVVAALFVAGYKYALPQKSFYVLLVTILYSYIALSHLVINMGESITNGSSLLYFLLFYFIFSAIMLIKYLRQFKKELQTI